MGEIDLMGVVVINLTFKNLYRKNSPQLLPTFLLKEGSLERSLTDGSRLVSFLTDTKSFQGEAFVIKQELLSRQNPIVQGRPNRRKPS